MMSTPEQTHAGVIRRLYEECLNQNNADVLPALLREDVVHHGAAEDHGIEAYRALIDRLRVAFPDLQFAVRDLIASEDRVVVRWTMAATHSGSLAGIAATGRRVEQKGNVIYRLKDGKIAEVWAQIDQVGMLRQLGIDPLASVKAAVAG